MTTLHERFISHEEADTKRFADLTARVDRMEAKVARGAFLGIVGAEFLAQLIVRGLDLLN